MFDLYTTIGDNFTALAHLSLFWGMLGFTVALYAKSLLNRTKVKARPKASL